MTMTVTGRVRFFIVVFIASLALCGRSHAQAFLNKVEGIWLFDEGKGETAEDFSGNGHDGKLMGELKYVEGQFGTALEFGRQGQKDWIEMDGPLGVNTVDFSFGCWMNPHSAQVCHANILGARDENGSETGFEFDQSQCSSNWFRIVIGGVINWDGIGNPRNTVRVEADVWSHVVFVRQGREGIWYLNGKPDRPKRGNFYIDLGSNRPVTPHKMNFRIGSPIYNDGSTFKGILDEVFVFRRALTQVEVTTVMERGIVGARALDARGKLTTVWGRIKS